MIQLSNLSKKFILNGKSKIVAQNINAIFPTGVSIGLLGRNGAGKSTLLEMISGTQLPTSGSIHSTGSISYPVGFAGSFHPELTGSQNARFVARIYGVDTDKLTEFVRDFAELGVHFELPFRTYSAGMRSRLAFGVSMGIKFDTYLVDEVTSVGDASFQTKSSALFRERMKTSGALVVSHSLPMIRNLCTAGAVLEGGRLFYYDKIEAAISHYNHVIQGKTPHWIKDA